MSIADVSLDSEWVSTDALSGIFEAARIQGFDAGQHLERAGIDSDLVRDGRGLIPFVSLCALLEAIAEKEQCPDFGFCLGMLQRPLQFGPISQLLLVAPNVGEAVRVFLRFRDLYSQASHWELLVQDGIAHLRRFTAGVDAAGPQLLSFTLTRGFEALKSLMGQEWRPIGIYFSHQELGGADAMRRHFGAPLFFNSQHCEIAFPAEELTRPLPTRNPELFNALIGYFEALLPATSRQAPWSATVQKQIRSRLGDQPCTIEAIAKALGLHPRSLQRKLEREGTSFRVLLAETRASTAEHLLSGSRLPLSDIASLVGFQHGSSFSRAFVNYRGVAPRLIRAGEAC